MKALDVLKLDAVIKECKTDIKMNRRPLKTLAADMTEKLGCKVAIGTLRDLLLANNIETRVKGRTTLQLEALAEENQALRELLMELLPHEANAPRHLVERIQRILANHAPRKTA